MATIDRLFDRVWGGGGFLWYSFRLSQSLRIGSLESVCSTWFDLTSLSLKLSVRRKATRCIDLKTLAQRGEEDEILKYLRIIDDN